VALGNAHRYTKNVGAAVSVKGWRHPVGLE
jgi:hypothetical protein